MDRETANKIIELITARFEENLVKRADCGGDVDLHEAWDMVVKEDEYIMQTILEAFGQLGKQSKE